MQLVQIGNINLLSLSLSSYQYSSFNLHEQLNRSAIEICHNITKNHSPNLIDLCEVITGQYSPQFTLKVLFKSLVWTLGSNILLYIQ